MFPREWCSSLRPNPHPAAATFSRREKGSFLEVDEKDAFKAKPNLSPSPLGDPKLVPVGERG
jgi:hypothetical protein